MDVYAPIWMYVKVYDGMEIVVNESIRKYMKLYDGIGIYMMVYGCSCSHMDVYGGI